MLRSVLLAPQEILKIFALKFGMLQVRENGVSMRICIVSGQPSIEHSLQRFQSTKNKCVDGDQKVERRDGLSNIFRLRTAHVQKFFNPNSNPSFFFKFKNPTPVQPPATIDATKIKQWL